MFQKNKLIEVNYETQFEGKDKEKGRKNDEVDPESLFCIGVLLENMPTSKLGF